MRKIPFIPILLTIAVAISIGLSYLLLFNPLSVYESINRSTNKVETEVVQPTSSWKLADVLGPTAMVAYDGHGYYESRDLTALNSLLQALASEPTEIQDITVEKQASLWQQLVQQKHLELTFISAVPVNALQSYFTLREGRNLAYEIDRLIWLESEPTKLYLVNSSEQSYLVVTIKQQESLPQLYQATLQGTEVEQVVVKQGVTYLPKKAVTLASEWYTLRKRSESKFLNTFFGSANYSITDTTNNNERKHKTYNLELDWFTDTQHYVAKSETYQNRAANTTTQLLLDSFSELEKYEQWNFGVRYMTTSSHQLVYRRLLNSYPIVANGTIDYGATWFEMTPKVTKFSGNLLELRAHVADKSQPVTLATAQEVMKTLAEQGVSLFDIDRIFIAYEWQKETENLQLVQLLPKWYIDYQGRSFSLEQVKDGTLKEWLSQKQQASKEAQLDPNRQHSGGDE